MWRVVAGLILAVVIVAGTMVIPIPRRLASLAAPAAFWRRESVRQRLRQRRPLLVMYAGLFAVAALVLVLWVLPSLLTEHPHIPKSADRHQAISNARTGLALMLTALGATGGLAYTARTYRLGQDAHRLSREGHITDRYSKAVEQLGDEKVEVRLGGIYALERLMRDSPADQPTIMETLAAFVRQHAPAGPRPPLPTQGSASSAPDHPAEDVQAGLTVLGRRQPVDSEGHIDLQRTNLAGANLRGANLAGADLSGADLAHAFLFATNLTRAELVGANLTDAFLRMANLTGAILDGATLTHGSLSDTQLVPRLPTFARCVGEGVPAER
ncbi:pentapeptide repeat-containing protein [Blastococcus mobilis]|uniref:Pentapeptide repeat-containing protein n=1 Tax=Blastococcus mobilis TaxID=1938746 RepID=A0A239APY9_9ACTN|nr:pentapeptide repeat-containing protein [Blastococcus mobilis]SNR97619.1 Pentapeptide repeat-containing protein [Blastococcus mobilis]